MDGVRLDVLLVQEGHFESRTQAREAVIAGRVVVDGVAAAKPAQRVPAGTRLEVSPAPQPFVSRGGIKLSAALEGFGIPVSGRTALDAGASTGGFTDCLLRRGARRVLAVDVGRDQLVPQLRADPRVRVLEGVNLRHLRPKDLPWDPHLVTLDLSFISLTLVLPAVAGLLPPGGEVVALLKPQFEAGPAAVGKGGIVKDPAIHRQVLHKVVQAARDLGFAVQGVMASPIAGREGNREFFIHLVRTGGGADDPGLSGTALNRSIEKAVSRPAADGC